MYFILFPQLFPILYLPLESKIKIYLKNFKTLSKLMIN